MMYACHILQQNWILTINKHVANKYVEANLNKSGSFFFPSNCNAGCTNLRWSNVNCIILLVLECTVEHVHVCRMLLTE